MGASRSRDRDPAETPTGAHSALPEDNIPYKGPSLQYAIVDMKVITVTTTAISTARYMKTDMAPHYQAFAGPYDAGFRAVLLKTVPGSRKKLHVQYGMERRYYIPFQAVFVKPANAPNQPDGKIKMIETNIPFRDFVAQAEQLDVETAHLAEFERKITENVHDGYRLVSFECTGYTKNRLGKSDKETILQVAMMFHRQLHPDPRGYLKFVYRSVIIPVSYTVVRRLPVSRRPVFALATDVTPQVTGMLGKGWKIVDVTYLSSHLQGVFNPRDDVVTFNSLWVFEMPSASAGQQCPQWECSIIKYSHIVKLIVNGQKPSTTWNPVVVEMGRRGWELAAILDTAESNPAGWGAVQTLLLIFQRPVLY